MMNSKSSGAGFQVSGVVLPEIELTRRKIRLYNVPDPLNGVKSSEKADTRRVFNVPGPVFNMFADTFQFVAVRPAA